MRIVIVLLTVIGGILAEAPLSYRYDSPQSQQQVHHTHDQLNGFRPSHGYPCPDGIVHHATDGRIMNQHFETPVEPILTQQLPAPAHPDKQITVNSQIAFGEHSHGEKTYSPTKAYASPQLPVAPNQYYNPQPLPIPNQHVNFHGSGSVVHGVGKSPPPFALNQHYHHNNHQIQIPVQKHRPLPSIPPIRPQLQYGPTRLSFAHQNNFAHQQAHAAQATIATGLISDNLIPPPIRQTHENYIDKSHLSSSGSFGSINIANGGYGGSIDSGSLKTGSTGPVFSSSNLIGQSGPFASSGSSSSGSLGFTSIGSTHNFNHPSLDEGISQVISETFANAGVGENVEKHIYVHVPPDDLEEHGHQHIQQNSPLSQPKKHYKIIFIKAPNQQPSTNIYTKLAQQQATEEKTLVYVLVKKPDEPTIQDIQQIQSTYKPSKPEVYFIKYKTRENPEGVGHTNVDDVDLTNGHFQGSDLSGGIDIRGGFNGESNTIHDAFASNIIEPRIPIGGNIAAPVYGPPDQH